MERPEWLWDERIEIATERHHELNGWPTNKKEMRIIREYIEHLEAERDRWKGHCADAMASIHILEDNLHQAKAIIEGLTAERDRAERALKRAVEGGFNG
jgi:hypothetical protein